MNEKKNIDKLFKEQLKNFEVAPKDHVWENIEERLHKDKRKKRLIIPIWWKAAGIAAGLVLLFTVANQIFNASDKDGISNDIVVDDSNSIDNNKSQNDTTTLDQNDSPKEIIENDEAEQIANTNSKSSIEDQGASKNKHKSNVINSDNKVDAAIASEYSNKESSKENTQNNSVNDYKKLLDEKRNLNQKPSTKDAVASTTKNASETNQNSQNSIKNKSEIDALLKSTKTETNTKDAVATKTSSKTNQNILKDKSEIDALLKSAKEQPNTSVANVNTNEKDQVENENSKIKNTTTKDTQNKEEEEKEKEADVNAIETAIAEAEDTVEKEEEEEKLSRWSVSPNIAPVYFSSLGNEGSSLDNQFVENSKETEINMSYGINGSYTVNKKFKIRAGINKVQLGYITNDVLIFENTNPVAQGARQIANVNLADSMSQHSIYSIKNFRFDNAPATLSTQGRGSLDQQLGFIEVPVEIEYNIVERKLGLNIIGGFSTLFLSDNDVYAVLNGGERTRLGEATNIKDLSYTANFGIGLDYNFSKQFQFNLEPIFKYQLNTFNSTSGDYKPFFVGVYTGLSFKF